MKILVIDDDEQIRRLLQKILIRAGYEVEEAANGEIGIEFYRRNPVEIVVTDISMPVKDGVEVINTLKMEFPNVKIIAMSGMYSSRTMLDSAKLMGADKILSKPIDNQKLLTAVDCLAAETLHTIKPKSDLPQRAVIGK